MTLRSSIIACSLATASLLGGCTDFGLSAISDGVAKGIGGAFCAVFQFLLHQSMETETGVSGVSFPGRYPTGVAAWPVGLSTNVRVEIPESVGNEIALRVDDPSVAAIEGFDETEDGCLRRVSEGSIRSLRLGATTIRVLVDGEEVDSFVWRVTSVDAIEIVSDTRDVVSGGEACAVVGELAAAFAHGVGHEGEAVGLAGASWSVESVGELPFDLDPDVEALDSEVTQATFVPTTEGMAVLTARSGDHVASVTVRVFASAEDVPVSCPDLTFKLLFPNATEEAEPSSR